MGSLMTDRELGLDETAVIIRATDEIKKLRKQSHGWHVMYRDAIAEIGELKEAIEEAAYLLHLDLDQVGFPSDGEQNARRRIIEAYNGTKGEE